MKKESGKIYQKKSLGQVFLNTDWPVKCVVEKMKSWGVNRVMEIGPGNGILTIALLQAGFKVTAVEKDTRFAERLPDAVDPGLRGKLEVRNEDILKVNLPEWIEIGTRAGEKSAVVGNIPYNISSPILLWVLPWIKGLTGVQMMVQLEFAQRLAASADTKNYGSLSVYLQLRSIVEFDCKVGREFFTPVPNVDSALFSLRPRDDMPPADVLKRTETVTRVSFTQRRKKLRNGVKPFLGDKSEEDCPIDLNRRAETLTPAEFIQLADFLLGQKKEAE